MIWLQSKTKSGRRWIRPLLYLPKCLELAKKLYFGKILSFSACAMVVLLFLQMKTEPKITRRYGGGSLC